MAERRMFSKSIVDSDVFLDMPVSAQCLYFHLGMRADDDGFVSNPKQTLRTIGANEDDLKVLIAKNFVIPFESGICVIRDWKINNYLRPDRYKETIYQNEKQALGLDAVGRYELGIPNVNQRYTQVSIDKDSIGKNNMSKKLDEGVKNLPYFEEFWKLYPRKEARKGALKAFEAALKDGAAPETILEGVKRYVAHIEANKTEQRFIKLPATWLNQGCWGDEYTCDKKQSKDAILRAIMED